MLLTILLISPYTSADILLCVSVGVGDGGNELGMGKLKEKVVNLMPKGNLIACVVPADYAITAGMDLQSLY